MLRCRHQLRCSVWGLHRGGRPSGQVSKGIREDPVLGGRWGMEGRVLGNRPGRVVETWARGLVGGRPQGLPVNSLSYNSPFSCHSNSRSMSGV